MYIGNNLIVQAPHVGSYVEVSSIYWWPPARRAGRTAFPITARPGRVRRHPARSPPLPVPMPPPTDHHARPAPGVTRTCHRMDAS